MKLFLRGVVLGGLLYSVVKYAPVDDGVAAIIAVVALIVSENIEWR